MIDNQGIFYITLVVAVFGKDKDDLKKNVSEVKTAAKRYQCTLRPLTYMQEVGLNSSLPLGDLEIEMDKLQTTSSATAFHPFSCVDLMHPRGIWYGQNNVSGNLCMVDRHEGMNYNGLIIGESGSGKSLEAKNEMTQAMMKHVNDSFYIIDPENEYKKLAEPFGGQVIRIATDTKAYINPLDMDMNYGDNINDSIAIKVDFLESIVETIMGESNELSPAAKSVIDRCGRNIYRPYLEHMKTLETTGVTIDYEAMPTLEDFYNELMAQQDETSYQLALAIEQYCIGTKNIFAHKTNVDTNARMVVFDVKDVGTGMKSLAIQVCLNYIWNKAISNCINAKKLQDGLITRDKLAAQYLTPESGTWVYIDEFHTLTHSNATVNFLVNLWKRARKWETYLTAITQNISDFMRTIDTQAILKNSNLIIMMTLSAKDRQDAMDLYNLSPSQLKHVAKATPGTGLFIWGEKTVIELDASYPSDTKLFKLITTKIKHQTDSIA